MSIAVDRISKQYGTFAALDDVSLRIETGELVALRFALATARERRRSWAFGAPAVPGPQAA